MIKVNIKKDFAGDWITREAGERLRRIIIGAQKKGKIVKIDFGGAVIASTSFFDEGFAKLCLDGWSEEKLSKFVKLKNIHPRDLHILNTVVANRRENPR